MDQDRWVVAGVDGSPEAERALRWAIDEARLRGAAVLIVTAWHVPVAVYTAHGASPPTGISLRDEIRKAAETVATTAARTVRDEAGLRAETRVVEGKPADVLVQSASGADMLVLGSRHDGALSALLANSVTVQCVLHAPAPTVVVR